MPLSELGAHFHDAVVVHIPQHVLAVCRRKDTGIGRQPALVVLGPFHDVLVGVLTGQLVSGRRRNNNGIFKVVTLPRQVGRAQVQPVRSGAVRVRKVAICQQLPGLYGITDFNQRLLTNQCFSIINMVVVQIDRMPLPADRVAQLHFVWRNFSYAAGKRCSRCPQPFAIQVLVRLVGVVW